MKYAYLSIFQIYNSLLIVIILIGTKDHWLRFQGPFLQMVLVLLSYMYLIKKNIYLLCTTGTCFYDKFYSIRVHSIIITSLVLLLYIHVYCGVNSFYQTSACMPLCLLVHINIWWMTFTLTKMMSPCNVGVKA